MQWLDVLSNPPLQNLPFKIELNEFGKLLMSSVSNLHGLIQGRFAATLWNDSLPPHAFNIYCRSVLLIKNINTIA